MLLPILDSFNSLILFLSVWYGAWLREIMLQYPCASAAISEGKKQIQKALSLQKTLNASKNDHKSKTELI